MMKYLNAILPQGILNLGNNGQNIFYGNYLTLPAKQYWILMKLKQNISCLKQ